MKTRAEFREELESVRRLNPPSQRLTSLGMHYIAIDGTPVLVLLEINVARLLAVVGKRCVRSKRGMACTARGAVRVSIATAEGRELAGRAAR